VSDVAAGFVGLGQIGLPLASRLLDWPGGLVVCDVVPEATEPFVDGGATVASTPAEVARAGASVISVMVRTEEQVRDVLLGPDGIAGAAAPGTVVAVHSTVSPAGIEALAAAAGELGVSVLDAPVTGGFFAAYEGKIAFMLGGDEAAVERCRPILERMSALIVHAGPVGAATRLKVARNILTFVGYAAGGEAQRLAEAAGLSLADLSAVVAHSDKLTGGPAAVMVRTETGALAAGDGMREIFEHTRDLGEKDLRLAAELAAGLGIDTPFTNLALEHLGGALGVPHES
jgi:3-hydroxyisobutyrate dehydrogenase